MKKIKMDRRDFIKIAAIAPATFLLNPCKSAANVGVSFHGAGCGGSAGGGSCTPGNTAQDSFTNIYSSNNTWAIVDRAVTVTGASCTFKYLQGYIQGGAGSSRYVGMGVWDDDGTGSGPGTLLVSGTIEGTSTGWFSIDVSGSAAPVSTGTYYIGWCFSSALMTMRWNNLSGTKTVYTIAGSYNSPDNPWDEDNDSEIASRDLSVAFTWE